MSSGKSVPLDVSRLKEFSFFPGQVVAVEGSNPTGKKIVVTAVTTPPVIPVFKTDVSLQGDHFNPFIFWKFFYDLTAQF